MVLITRAGASIRRGVGRLRLRRLQQVGRQAHFALRAELTGLRATRADHGCHNRRGQLIVRTYITQRAVQGAVEEVMHHAPITEAHFVLGGVHVDVYHRRVDFKEQHKRGVAPVEQHVAIRLAHRMGHQLVAHRTAIHKEILQVRLAAGEGRQTNPPPQAQAIALDFNRQRLLKETRPANRRHTASARGVIVGFVQAEDGLAVMPQVERHIEASQSQTLDDFLQVIEFGFLSLEEFTPRRGVEEQVAHFHRRTDGMGCRLDPRRHVATFGFHLPGLLGAAGAGRQGQARHRADGRQGLTAKAQAHHPLKVFQVANLAGGVTGQGQRQIVGRDTAAIVTHAQQLDATLLHVDINALGAGVDAVFQQLLDHRCRTLHNLTRRNLVGKARAEQFDA